MKILINVLLQFLVILLMGCTLILNNGTIKSDDRDNEKSGINIENEPDTDNRKRSR